MDDEIAKEISEAIRKSVTSLPDDVLSAIREAHERESSEIAKTQFKAILENIEMGMERGKPLCQDTGTITFYITAGASFPFLSELEEILIRSTRMATEAAPLRPNTVDPFTNKNAGDNTGRYIPYLNWEIVEGDEVDLWVLPKGGGSENSTALAMISPSLGIDGVKKFVIDHSSKVIGRTCPPVVIGVGISGVADLALKLAKKLLLSPIGERNPDPAIARLEVEIKDAINSLGIGAMGLGGDTSVLGVKIDYSHRHPASLAAGIAYECWCDRKAHLRIGPDRKVEVLQ
jgi:fumarate hydratase subunit alpha